MRFSQARDQLPTLGVGASLSFGTAPDPVALAQRAGGPAFIEYAGAVQHSFLRGPLAELERLKVPVLYHPSCLNLWSSYGNPKPWLEAVKAHVAAVKSAWLAQDVALCFASTTPGYSIQLGYFVAPILTEATLAEAVKRVEEVLAVVDAPLLLEPAPVTFVLGDLDIFSWLGGLAERTDCGLLLDAGHVVSHQLARRAPSLLDGLERLDLSRVVEVHLAGGVIKQGPSGQRVYVDAHELPVLPETWQVFEHLLERTPNLRAVCVECEGTMAASVLPVLEQTRRAVSHGALNAVLRAKVDTEMAAVSP